MDWDGSRWIEPATSPVTQAARARPALRIFVLLVILAAAIAPLSTAFAGRKSAPTMAVDCGSHCVVGSSITVSGSGFVPSSGGQQVILYVEPSGSPGGFYLYPWVDDAGSFSTTVTNALTQPGAGRVDAIQYNARNDKWANVGYVEFIAN